MRRERVFTVSALVVFGVGLYMFGYLHADDSRSQIPTWTRFDGRKVSAHGSDGVGLELSKEEVEAIARVDGVEYVSINCVWIDEGGLAAIAKAPRIKGVELYRTNISDAGIKAISLSQSIELLSISGSSISARALEHIKQMKHLKELHIRQSPLISNEKILAFVHKMKGVAVEADVVTP